MKMSLCLAFCVLSVLSFTGCDDKSDAPPVKTFEMPAAASRPDAMAMDEFLYIVNELWGYEDESQKKFRKEDAEVFKVPAPPEGTETLYLFLMESLEIGIFAGSEKDCITSAYVRVMLDDTSVIIRMMHFASSFLAALEPDRYEKMLSSVLPAGEENLDESKTAFGEYWRVRYSRTLMNILPLEEMDDSPISTND